MSYSQGNIIFHSNTAASGGGVTGADNGLILLGSVVEMGAPLIHDTNIDPSGFTFDIGYSAGSSAMLLLDQGNFMGVPYVRLSVGDSGLYIDDSGCAFLSPSSNVLTGGTVTTGLNYTGFVALRIRQFGFDIYGNICGVYDPGGSNLQTFKIDLGTGAITTGVGSSEFLFKNVATSPVVFDSAHYVDVVIGGASYKLALAT